MPFPVSPPFLPSPMATQQLSFGYSCSFLSASVTTLWLMLLSFITSSTALTVSPGPLLASLSVDSVVYCFSTPSCLLFLLHLCSFWSCYMLCSAVPYSHGIALFHVPNDGSSLWETSLKNTLPFHQRVKLRGTGLTGRTWKIRLLSRWKQLVQDTDVSE